MPKQPKRRIEICDACGKDFRTQAMPYKMLSHICPECRGPSEEKLRRMDEQKRHDEGKDEVQIKF